MNASRLDVLDDDFAAYWRGIDWTGSHEVDVREDLITHVLPHLGYARGTTKDIVREERFALSEPYLRIGRDSIKIDYAPRVRLRRFFIIETKSPADAIDAGVLHQALFYAAHPEVSAKFVCLTNGKRLEVYRVGSEPYNTPVLAIDQESVTGAEIGRLRQLVGAEHIASTLRTETLETLRETFAVEVEEAAVDRFCAELSSLVIQVKPVVRSNAREITVAAWREARAEGDRQLRATPFDTLLIVLDTPTNATRMYGIELARRIEEAPLERRRGLFDQVARTWRSRVHGVFRVQCLLASLTLLERNIELGPASTWSSSLETAIDELARGAQTYYGANALAHALCHLDNACIRVAYKLVRKVSIEALSEQLAAERVLLSAEDRLRDIRSVAHGVLEYTNLWALLLWHRLKSAPSADTAGRSRWELEQFEQSIDALPGGTYPSGDGDLYSFEYYGCGFDMLFMGSWDMLHVKKDLVTRSMLSDSTRALAAMSREEASASIPIPTGAPNRIDLTDPTLLALERMLFGVGTETG